MRDLRSAAVTAVPFLGTALLLAVVLGSGSYQPAPDGASYLSLADHWASGRWEEAVNGYWSPLLPLLLAPVIAVGGDPMVGYTLLAGFAALAALAILGSLLRLLGASTRATVVVLLGVSGLLVDAAAELVGPDLVVAALLLGYVRLAVDPRMGRDPGWALATGLIGGVAYLAKAVALPVVAVHLLVVAGLRIAGASPAERRRVAGTWLVAVAGATLVTGPWIGAISAQADRATISTAAGANLAWSIPGTAGNQLLDPGLKRPPTPNAVSSWDDPVAAVAAIEDGGGAPTADVGSLLGQLPRTVVGNLLPGGAITTFGAVQRVALAMLLAAAPVLVFLRRRHPTALLALAAAGVHLAVLLVTYVEPRYALAPILLLIAVGAPPVLAVGDRLLASLPGRIANLQGAVAVTAVAILLVPTVPRLLAWTGAGYEHLEAAAAVAPAVEGRQVASDSQVPSSIWVCAVAGCAFHGQPRALDDPDALRRELLDADIERYLVWRAEDGRLTAVDRSDGRNPAVPSLPTGATPISVDDRVTVYALTP